MNKKNVYLIDVSGRDAVMCLELGERATAVAHASVALSIRCLRGGVWITQASRREDFFLLPGDRFQALPRRRVYLDAFKGAVVAVGGAATRFAGEPGSRPASLALRIKIVQGTYRLSGGENLHSKGMSGVRDEPGKASFAAVCLE